MAYDGIFIKSQIKEISSIVLNEHIAKITQKSHKEINFHYRKNSKNLILTLCANPNFPHILLDDESMENPTTPPGFCMLLRKYLQGGKIIDIRQIGKRISKDFNEQQRLERIVKFTIENINDCGDKVNYNLYFEIMGKYSNIIITDQNDTILDILIKSTIENPRLVLKCKYSIKDIANKSEILNESFDEFMSNINETKALAGINDMTYDLADGISSKYAGLSKPYILSEIITYISSKHRISNNKVFNYDLINKYVNSKEDFEAFFNFLKCKINELINKNEFYPVINFKGEKPSDFYLYKLKTFEGEIKEYDSINNCIKDFIKLKHSDMNDTSEKKNLEEIVKKLYIKLNKKLDIYKKDLAKCDNIDVVKNYAELVSAFGYNLEDIKDGLLTCKDYNHNDEIVHIPVDESLTVAQNVERYYDKYNKLKRTKDNAENLINEINDKIEHLNSIAYSLRLPNDKYDLYLIKEEIIKYFDESNKIQSLKKQKNDNKKRNDRNSNKKNKNSLNYNIHHYKSSSGIDIYVGKNNLQNEYLTFTLANADDTWLHIKNSTGSHVIVKMPYEKLDDKTLIEAASLAAYFSEKRNETKATVDYTLRKELKKVKGKSPGFCIYHKNYSINVKPEILINEI